MMQAYAAEKSNLILHISAPVAGLAEPGFFKQELAKSNPQLIQLINENQEEFMRMINEPVDPAVMEEVFGAAGAAGVAGQGTLLSLLLSMDMS